MADCKKCAERSEAWDMLSETRALLVSIDAMIDQAMETGIDTGRVLGILEAASALEGAGYLELAKTVRRIVVEDSEFYGSRGDA